MAWAYFAGHTNYFQNVTVYLSKQSGNPVSHRICPGKMSVMKKNKTVARRYVVKLLKTALVMLSVMMLGTQAGFALTRLAPDAKITAPAKVTGGQAAYSASVPSQSGATFAWTVENGTIMSGALTECISFMAGKSGNVTLTCKVTLSGQTATGTAKCQIVVAKEPQFNIKQALSDRAQSTTIAFAGFGMMTGNLGAQSFFPPGKVADYWGFQYLRDNDADRMGHNTSFLTRVACNMLFIFNDTQMESLRKLAKAQVVSNNLYAWKRYPLMTAFRRLIDGKLPTGKKALDIEQVKLASKDLYILDGQISYDRAVVYADIIRSLTSDQKIYIGAMTGKGYKSWPDKDEKVMKDKTKGLTHDEVVAVMTYASDFYSWFAGSVAADIYFCPERHGTYYGSFYIKDAPAVGNPGYGIDESLTATVGNALCNEREGFISREGAKIMNSLVDKQKPNLSGNAKSSIVLARTKISEALRSLISSEKPSADKLKSIKSEVEKWSGIYGELDGENNWHYATTFNKLFNNLGGVYITDRQKEGLRKLRQKYMTVTYPNGKTIDFSSCSKYFLYAAEVKPESAEFVKYTDNTATDKFFK